MKTIATLIFLSVNFTVFSSGWVQKADFGGEARHRTVALSIGNYVYIGLGHYNGAGPNILFDDWWEYDPGTNAWTQKANYMGGPTYHSAGFTINNIGYVGTGRIIFGLVKDFYAYDPSTNMWTQLSDFPGSARRGGVAFTIGEYGYMGTGTYNSDFYRYDPSNDSWSPIASMPGSGRISAVGFRIGELGYVGTGSEFGATNDFWEYNPVTNSWTAKANVGPTPRQEAGGFSLNGKGYILTGDDFSSGNNFKDVWEYEPSTDTWIQLPDFDGTARRYLSCVTHNGVAYAGLGTSGTNFNDFWLFDQTLSILERNLDIISVQTFPNPATDFVTFEIKGLENISLENVKVSIHSVTGEKVFSEYIESNITTVQISDYARELYMYTLTYKDHVLKAGKLIIK